MGTGRPAQPDGTLRLYDLAALEERFAPVRIWIVGPCPANPVPVGRADKMRSAVSHVRIQVIPGKNCISQP